MEEVDVVDRTCSKPGCNRPSAVRGCCRSHYQQLRKSGAIETRGFYATDAACSVVGCPSPPKSVGMCSVHRRRLRKHGSTELVPREPWEPRFWDKVYPCPITGCWLWGASVQKKRGGYGQFAVRSGFVRTAHIVSYELANGPVPDGLVLDHLCRVTCCVNPDHLEPVTYGENNRRGMAPGMVTLRTNICRRGHELTPENTYRAPSGGRRQCRACIKINKKRRTG